MSRIGSRGLTSKLEGEQENKPEIIAAKTTQGLKVRLRGTWESGGTGASDLLAVKERSTKVNLCQKCGTNTLKRHLDTTEDFKNTKS